MITNTRDSIDEICPLRNFKINKLKEPWISNELIEKIKDKDRAMKKAKKSKKDEDWKLAKRLRNEYIIKMIVRNFGKISMTFYL